MLRSKILSSEVVDLSFVVKDIYKMHIPLFPCADNLVRHGNDSGTLSLKDAYQFLNQAALSRSCSKLIWG